MWIALLAALTAAVAGAAGAPPEFAAGDTCGDLLPEGLAGVLAGIDRNERGPICAGAHQILALEASPRNRLIRWVRAGGRLVLVGDAVGPAVSLLLPREAPLVGGAIPLGLGEVRVSSGSEVPDESPRRDTCDLVPPAAALARAALPADRVSGAATASFLLIYGVLLGAGFILTRSSSLRSRVACGTALAPSFGLWPLAGAAVFGTQERWAQVDVVADVDEGPSLLWSGVAFVGGGRRSSELRPDESSWGLRPLKARGITGPVQAAAAHSGGHGPSARFEAVRGARVELGWLSEGNSAERVHLEISRRDGRLTGLVRNGIARSWTDVWVLLPRAGPVHLEDLPPSGALMVEAEESSIDEACDGVSLLRTDLPLGRSELLQTAFHCAIEELLARGRPVLVAWSTGPLYPAHVGQGAAISTGTTLLIAAGKEMS